MNDYEEGLAEEIPSRIARVRARMAENGYDALLVYGNNKVNGSLRYVSGYFPDRGGWLATGPSRADITIFDAATLVLPLEGEPVLVFDKGQLLDREAGIATTSVNGFGGELAQQPPVPEYVAQLLQRERPVSRIGIETWDKFPAPFFFGLQSALPGVELTPSTVVEEIALIKSAWEIEAFRAAGRVGDIGHRAFEEALRRGPGQSELVLIRAAEAAMRELDPIYEEVSPASPSLICSGGSGRLSMLHTPLNGKTIEEGDVVNWDLALRHLGYPVDTSRTRTMGTPTAAQRDAYRVVLDIRSAILEAVRPGAQVQDLVTMADRMASEAGLELYDRFIGHGLGLDVHVRPDMGMEEMLLEENMLITVEPRIVFDGEYLMGNEDMVLVTADGAEPLGSYPLDSLELG